MAETPPPPAGKPAVSRRRVVVIGAAVVAVIVGYAYWRNRQSGQVLADPATGTQAGDAGYSNPNPDGSGFDEVSTDDGLITTNAEWLSDVLDKMEARNIYDPAAAAIILSKYLSGQPVTQDEANVVRTAWGLSGHPPQDVPLHIIATSTASGGGTTTTGGAGGGTTTTTTPKPYPPRRYVHTGVYGVSSPAWKNTLSGIAGRTGRTVKQLALWNGITNVNIIPANHDLWIDPPGTYNGKIEFKG